MLAKKDNRSNTVSFNARFGPMAAVSHTEWNVMFLGRSIKPEDFVNVCCVGWTGPLVN